ncbi:NepR family anti-sigma factor [Sphingomonas sp. 37zxx]|uniref:NepR family anti-sigma factor n=1 Tax=Sphingomonas sp. 37zxx TaxID=1550073 RepID=UPI0018CD06A5|nr:NepR family anti-sigma factor [Sphingomonas sp. 37zxx]
MRPGNKPTNEAKTTKQSSKARHSEKAVGDALRAVYRQAVDESIPDELLDLLRKLD